MKTRILSGTIFAVIGLAIILLQKPLVDSIAITVLALIACYEFFKAFKNKGINGIHWIGYMGCLAIMLLDNHIAEEYKILIYNGKKGYVKDKEVKKILQEFIDVDISEQKLRYYDSDGKVIVKSDIVTGLPIKDRETRKGWFKIFAMNTNRYLVGPNYKSYVSFFMPFDGGIGLHDADGWRKEYGGNIYKTNGSHGCVNMPYNKVKKVYKKAKVGTRVLVHR